MSAAENRLPAIGSRARLRHEVERFPHFLIDGGATGTITEATESLIALRMDEFVPGAEEWDNEPCWTQEDGDFSTEADATAEQRIAAAFHGDAEIIDNPRGDREMNGTTAAPVFEAMGITPKQKAGIEESMANIAANPGADLLGVRILENGDEFGGFPEDALIVEFTYRDLVNDTGTPGREVTVFAADGNVLDSQDLG